MDHHTCAQYTPHNVAVDSRDQTPAPYSVNNVNNKMFAFDLSEPIREEHVMCREATHHELYINSRDRVEDFIVSWREVHHQTCNIKVFTGIPPGSNCHCRLWKGVSGFGGVGSLDWVMMSVDEGSTMKTVFEKSGLFCPGEGAVVEPGDGDVEGFGTATRTAGMPITKRRLMISIIVSIMLPHCHWHMLG